MSKELFDAVQMLAQEKGIPEDYLYEKISAAIVVAAKHDYNGKDIVHCDIDPEKQSFKVYVTKNVVEEVEDPDTDLTLEEAQAIKKSAKVGKTIDIPLKTKEFGRFIAQTAKHVIRQGIREAERGKLMEEFQSKNQELISAKVLRVDPVTGNATLEIGKNEAVLPKAEQVPGEELVENSLIKIFVVDVKDGSKGPKIMISRTHPGLVRRLFEQEVPEIFDGTIEIKSVSREAGSRTKIAVFSKEEDVDPVGACIGPRGQRVSNIVDALGGEKIDIVKYNDDVPTYIAAALAPADVVGVEILDEEARSCRATVPDDQLSLAIGNKGQNVRLAAKLTGWKIDIKPESGFYDGTQQEAAACKQGGGKMKAKKVPVRMCAGCGGRFDKRDLVRVVRTPQGDVQLDLTGKMAGRGAYVCHDPACLQKARKKRAFERALEVTISDAVYDRMEAELKDE